MAVSFWRAFGLNFPQYMQMANTAARSATKPDVQAKYMVREQFNYNHTVWADRKKISTKTYSSFAKKD